MYVDRPSPRGGYLFMIVALMAPVVALMLLMPSPWPIKALMAIPVLLLLAILHAAYATRYTVGNGSLELRCGWVMPRKRIPLNEIAGPKRVGFNQRLLGWGIGARGYCNRFGNGVLFQYKGIDYYCSPSDPDRFIDALATGGAGEESQMNADLREKNVRRGKLILILLFVAVGIMNMGIAVPMILGNVPPNGSYGVRTAATMSDPDIWYPANEFGGKAIFAAGAVCFTGSVIVFLLRDRMSLMWAGGILLVLLLVPVILAGMASVAYANDLAEQNAARQPESAAR